MATTSAKDKPYVDNYPPLKAWLTKHGARCNWQLPLGDKRNPTGYVESWIVRGGGEVLLVIHANRVGWNLFTPGKSNGIEETFADAEARLGLVEPFPNLPRRGGKPCPAPEAYDAGAAAAEDAPLDACAPEPPKDLSVVGASWWRAGFTDRLSERNGLS